MHMVKTPDWPADRLKALIDRILDGTGLNQTKLAALVGINPSQVSRWVNGSSRPKFETLAALGKAIQERYPELGIGPDDLTAVAYPREAAVERSLASLMAVMNASAAEQPNLPPEFGEIKDPTPTEAVLLQTLTAMQEELKALTAKIDALAADREREEDENGAAHQRGA